jgi:hypothetical protein
VKEADEEQQGMSKQAVRSKELAQLKEQFLQLSTEPDRNKAGIALEGLLNKLFMVYELNPRSAFRVIGEQIDGSFVLEGEVYLVEAKWEKAALPEADLLVFRGKIEGKSTFTRGVFIALNDVTDVARDAITRGKSPSFFVMNGYDLMMILSGAISLTDFLKSAYDCWRKKAGCAFRSPRFITREQNCQTAWQRYRVHDLSTQPSRKSCESVVGNPIVTLIPIAQIVALSAKFLAYLKWVRVSRRSVNFVVSNPISPILFPESRSFSVL